MAKEKQTTAKTPVRRGRKSRISNVEVITLAMRQDKAREEFYKFYYTLTEVEQAVLGKLKPYGPDAENLVMDARRLLNESIAKCKVIPFPLDRVRKDSSESITIFMEGQKYEF